MSIYENNKQLLTVLGGNADKYSTDFEVRKAILDLLGGDSSKCYSIYEVDKQILNIYQEGGGGTSGGEKVKVRTLDIDNSCIVDGTWGAESIDTSLMTNMSYMFSNCTSLQSVDVSNWDTSNVTNMGSMFYSCTSLQSLDVSNWDTSNVTNMSSMFSNYTSLQSVDVSNWDTSNVTNMSYMFSNCTSLQSVDVSNWDTSNVTNMYYMFSGCDLLQSLDVSGWDASNVQNIIYNMFGNYNSNISTLVGGKTLDEVITNNIGILNGVKVNLTINVNGGTIGIDSFLPNVIDSASIRALMNGIADLTGQSSKTIRLSNTVKAKLTTEDIAIATAKNWTII